MFTKLENIAINLHTQAFRCLPSAPVQWNPQSCRLEWHDKETKRFPIPYVGIMFLEVVQIAATLYTETNHLLHGAYHNVYTTALIGQHLLYVTELLMGLAIPGIIVAYQEAVTGLNHVLDLKNRWYKGNKQS